MSVLSLTDFPDRPRITVRGSILCLGYEFNLPASFKQVALAGGFTAEAWIRNFLRSQSVQDLLDEIGRIDGATEVELALILFENAIRESDWDPWAGYGWADGYPGSVEAFQSDVARFAVPVPEEVSPEDSALILELGRASIARDGGAAWKAGHALALAWGADQ